MSIAEELRQRVGPDANLEFASGGYRLSLNPLEDCFDETGFILWREEATGPVPVATGRAVGDELIVEDAAAYDGKAGTLESLIAALIQGEPVAQAARPNPDDAVPTGT